MILTKSKPFTVTETQLLIGSLSNDLFRVASLTQRGSKIAAQRFILEAKRWAKPLQSLEVPRYISKIAQEVSQQPEDTMTEELAEKYLMYGILLQNFVMHTK